MLKTGEAQTLAKEAIGKAGYDRHALETDARERAVSAESFEEKSDERRR